MLQQQQTRSTVSKFLGTAVAAAGSSLLTERQHKVLYNAPSAGLVPVADYHP
jgi:hypothetical protein